MLVVTPLALSPLLIFFWHDPVGNFFNNWFWLIGLADGSNHLAHKMCLPSSRDRYLLVDRSPSRPSDGLNARLHASYTWPSFERRSLQAISARTQHGVCGQPDICNCRRKQ